MIINNDAMGDNIKLSPYSKTFYAEWVLTPKSARYNILLEQVIYGDLEPHTLANALRRFILQHYLLNSHLQIIDDELYWVENQTVTPMISLDKDNNLTDAELLKFINEPFDLYSGPLYRFLLVQLSPKKYRFVIVLHHLIIDAMSGDQLFDELSIYYNDDNYINKFSIEEQKKLIKNLNEKFYTNLEQNKDKYKHFWHKHLDELEGVDLKFLQFKNESRENLLLEQFNSTTKIVFEISPDYVAKLSKLKRKYLITPYVYGLSILALNFYKYTNQKKFALSYPLAIKDGVNFIYGAQVNTSIIPFEFLENTTIVDIYNQIRQFIHSLKEGNINYSYYPITDIITENNKYFLNAIFNQANFRNKGFTFKGTIKAEPQDRFNMYLLDYLLFEQELRDGRLYYQIRYDNSIINEQLLLNFIDSYKKLFTYILDMPENDAEETLAYEYSVLTEKDYTTLNSLKPEYDSTYLKHSILKLFEEQVNKVPNNIAVRFENVSVTYNQLNQLANELSYYLKEKYNLTAGSFIVLYLERSHHMIVLILAILKLRCAYIPIDMVLHANKIKSIIINSKSKLILANKSNYINMTNILEDEQIDKNIGIEVIEDIYSNDLLKQYPKTDLPIVNNSHDVVYTIYTSGTTASPKGILMEQLSCVNRILQMIKISGVGINDKVLFKTNYAFDVAFSDIFTTLLSGACLLITKNTFDIEEIVETIVTNGLSVCHFTPSQFEAIKDIFLQKLNNYIKVINFSGEALDSRILAGINKKTKCINYYGPTETGEVTAEIINLNNANNCGIATIGYAFNNTYMYILDDKLSLVPVGVIGELYVGGVAVAKGYINQENLSKNSFIANPFQSANEKALGINDIIYKTGDLVRCLPDGNIEYLSRNDFQVKIRGYRVELQEIVRVIRSYNGITQVHVVVDNNTFHNVQNLIAYYISNNNCKPEQLETYASFNLPPYMIPSKFIQIKETPLTSNGKLNLKLLPDLDFTHNEVYIAPVSNLEKKICHAFAQLLSLAPDKVGLSSDFFKLGGNSLLAIKLIIRLQNICTITVNDLFVLRTPGKIATFVPNTINDLKAKKQLIKSIYMNKLMYVAKPDSLGVESYKFDIELKDIKIILLTGATGYLGCNLLYQLFSNPSYKIIALVRGESNTESYLRLSKKFKFYFNEDLDTYKSRINVFSSDIEEANLGLDTSNYQYLADNVDSIIHCAALVKHYGYYEEFYKTNVKSSINLLELARVTQFKDFHYISTVGVCLDGYIENKPEHIFNEYDTLESLSRCNNLYAKTKFEAEQMTIKYRQFGVKTNIYRIGNLVMHSKRGIYQENSEDNLFFSHIKTVVDLKYIPEELCEIEMSPVDFTATAILKIFNQVNLSNATYHILNPNVYNLGKLLNYYPELKIQKVNMELFIQKVLDIIDATNNLPPNLLMLYQLWIQESQNIHTTMVKIDQNKTLAILAQLGFYWDVITDATMLDMLKIALK